MKAILISIHPQWVALILNFIKKDEIRKGTAIGKAINRLIKEQGVAPMLIYCTKGKWGLYDNRSHITSASDIFFIDRLGYDKPPLLNGKVVARFNATAEEIICRPICGEWECYTKTQGYSEIAKASCLKNKDIVHYLKGKNGTSIHINDLEIFDKPKELSEFAIKNCKTCIANDGTCHLKNECAGLPLIKAPQSWCYVEVLL